MDLRARRGPISRSHVWCEWSRMSMSLKDLIGQSYLFGGSDFLLSSGLIGKKGILMPGVRRNWLWSEQNDPDRLCACVKRSRYLGWKRDKYREAPHKAHVPNRHLQASYPQVFYHWVIPLCHSSIPHPSNPSPSSSLKSSPHPSPIASSAAILPSPASSI